MPKKTKKPKTTKPCKCPKCGDKLCIVESIANTTTYEFDGWYDGYPEKGDEMDAECDNWTTTVECVSCGHEVEY